VRAANASVVLGLIGVVAAAGYFAAVAGDASAAVMAVFALPSMVGALAAVGLGVIGLGGGGARGRAVAGLALGALVVAWWVVLVAGIDS
jgi:hypothetical protein